MIFLAYNDYVKLINTYIHRCSHGVLGYQPAVYQATDRWLEAKLVHRAVNAMIILARNMGVNHGGAHKVCLTPVFGSSIPRLRTEECSVGKVTL